MPGRNVVIAGGGIGGLAAALALARKGIATVVCEQASAFGEIGAGIQIAPNAFHCFDRLGIGEQARRGAVYVDKLRLMDGLNGQEICHIPLGDEFRAHFGNPYAVVHRADLHQAVLDACRETGLVDLRTRSEVTGYHQSGDEVSAQLASGDAIHCSALIGADGLHSKIRQQVIADGPPRVSGHTTYRSVIPTDMMPEDLRWNAATLWAGPKCHIVHYPLKGGEVFNLVVTYHNDVSEPVAGVPVSKNEVRRGFEHIHPRAQQVIDHGTDWKLWVLCDRDPNENWIDGHVTLLGDAAHPMLQYFAQGACMALEDAVVLADCFSRDDDIPTALRTYRDKRFARTSSVQMGSRLIGDHIYHAAAGQAAMRDAIMSSKSPTEWNRELDWLYSDAAISAR
ncbi:MAG: 3-hydroxybenzoate 6-monooxygenase [Pseudomonadota bacterium]